MRLRSLLGLLLPGLLVLTASAAESPRPHRTFRVTVSAVVKSIPAGSRRVDLWMPYPQSDRNQTIHEVRLTASSPVTLGRSEPHGNQMLHVSATGGGAPPEVRMEILVTRCEAAMESVSLSRTDTERYLQPEPLVPIDGPVGALAREAVAGKKSETEKARAIYARVTSMMKYDKSGTGWGRGDALFACDARRGNCTDFHSLIIGMARSQGIPARFAMGLPLPSKRGTGAIPGYHCWAELYIRGRGWIPIDSSEAAKAVAAGEPHKLSYYFGHLDENRLEFSRGRHLLLHPLQKDALLNFFIYPYLEVDGKKHDGLEWKFEYADVEAPAGRF